MMMKTLFAFMAFTVLFAASAAFAGPHGQENPDRTGILIASFGTSMPEARKAIDNLVDSAKKSFPDAEVRLAFTSNIIRRKIAREQNIEVPTPVEALYFLYYENHRLDKICSIP